MEREKIISYEFKDKFSKKKVMLDGHAKGMKGLPFLSGDRSTIEKIAVMSKKYNTNIEIIDSMGYIQISKETAMNKVKEKDSSLTLINGGG